MRVICVNRRRRICCNRSNLSDESRKDAKIERKRVRLADAFTVGIRTIPWSAKSSADDENEDEDEDGAVDDEVDDTADADAVDVDVDDVAQLCMGSHSSSVHKLSISSIGTINNRRPNSGGCVRYV